MMAARVVGLGEATHASHEIAEAKITLFKLLVRDAGVRCFAIEGDWAEWTAMDAYVRGETSPNATALVAGQDFSVYRNMELVDVLTWIRDYNAAHPSDIVGVTGVDFQEPEKTRAIAASKTSLAPEAAAQLQRAQDRIAHPSLRARDADMTAKFLALAQRCKVALWAHDGHVAAYDEANASWYPMGTQLRSALGASYFAVGTVVGEGSFRARPAAGKPAVVMSFPQTGSSASNLFSQLHRVFFLNVSAVPAQSDLGAWLATAQSTWIAGGTVAGDTNMYLQYVFTRAFDAIVFIPTVTPTTPI